jgi:hypothetical protein
LPTQPGLSVHSFPSINGRKHRNDTLLMLLSKINDDMEPQIKRVLSYPVKSSRDILPSFKTVI